MENLHWIDPTSEAFLARLVDSIAGAPILVLATYRPGYRPPWLEKSYATQLTLAPLSPQDSVQVVQAVLATETVPDAAGPGRSSPRPRAIPSSWRSSPRRWWNRARCRRAGGMTLPPTLPLPATVQAVLAARIDRLPPEEKALLQTAAVIGTEVPLAAVAGHGRAA